MISFIKGVSDAPLLRRIWLQLVTVGAVILSALQVTLGYDEYQGYKSGVIGCVSASLKKQNNAIAFDLKSGRIELVISKLNSLEASCAFPKFSSVRDLIQNDAFKQASFTWIIQKRGSEQHQVGKNLLKGPKEELLYPVSLWSNEGPGDYWVGSIQLNLYFGDFVSQVIKNGWRAYGFNVLTLFVLSTLGMMLVYRNYTRPNAEFVAAVQGWRSDTPSLKGLIDRYDGELVGLWRLYVDSREQYDIERFELESQLRDLEGHVSKLERGQSGQSLNTERSSLDLKQSLFQVLVELDHNEQSTKLEGVKNYVEAFLGVCANLHERALTESAEVRVLSINYSPHLMVAQIFQEFKERFVRKHITYNFSVSVDTPEFVVGDPEKVKRIIRNGLRRALMQPHVETIDFSVSFGVKGTSGQQVEYELIAVPNQVATMNLTDTDREALKRLEKGPTPMLETLCQLMAARWTFASGLDGELRQSLSVPYSPSKAQRLSQPVQNAALGGRRVLLLGIDRAQVQGFENRLEKAFHACDALWNDKQLFDQAVASKGWLAQTDVAIITDCLKSIPIIDMVAALKRAMPPGGVIILVARYPQIGDARYYQDIGVNGYLPEFLSESYLPETIAIALMRRAETSGVPELTTRYSVLEQYAISDNFAMPPALYWTTKNSLLMVSQDLVGIELLRKACKRYRVRFVHFSHAFEAVEAFKYELFELVLIDEGVQDVDSLSIVQLFRQVEDKRSDSFVTPIVALSSNGSDKEYEIFESAGVTELFKKPVMNSEIALLFEQILK